MTERPWKMSGIAVEYWYPMVQYTASHRAAAHIMKPVVSISMSPESFSSGDNGMFTVFEESPVIDCMLSVCALHRPARQ